MTTSARSAADGVRPAIGDGGSGSGRPPKRLRRLARSPGEGEGSRCIWALAFRGRRGASARVYERPNAISRTFHEVGNAPSGPGVATPGRARGPVVVDARDLREPVSGRSLPSPPGPPYTCQPSPRLPGRTGSVGGA